MRAATLLERLVPTWLLWVLLAACVVWFQYQVFSYGRQTERLAWQLSTTKQAATTSEGHRAQEGATAKAQDEADDAHIQTIRQLSDQRDAAAAAAERLRKQLAAAQRVANGGAKDDPAADRSGPAVAALAAVLGACEAEYRAMGRAAAEHLAAGQLCEARYDALTAKPGTPDSGSGQ
jgi:predicted membrane metal-binding protein